MCVNIYICVNIYGYTHVQMYTCTCVYTHPYSKGDEDRGQESNVTENEIENVHVYV